MAKRTAKIKDGTQRQIQTAKGEKYGHVHPIRRIWRFISTWTIGKKAIWIAVASVIGFVVSVIGFVASVTGILGYVGINPTPLRPQITVTLSPPPTSVTIAPSPIATANTDEILLLLADFRDESENVTYDAASSIEEKLRSVLNQYGLGNVRLERVSQSFKRNELEAVKSLGKGYNATVFIWGSYDDGGMFPHFTILQEEKLKVKLEEPHSCLANLAKPPDDFTLYVNRDLPSQMTFLAQVTIGRIFLLKHAYSDALKLFEDATKLNESINEDQIRKNLALVYFSIGYIYHQRGDSSTTTSLQDYKQALPAFNKTIELNPSYPQVFYNRGNVYYDLKEYDQAIADYTKAIGLNPKDASSFYSRGNIYKFQEKYTQALADYTKSIELEPTKCAYNNRGNIRSNQHDLTGAMSDYTKAIELDPNFEKGYFNRAGIYHQFGDFKQAIQEYTKGLDLAPNEATAYLLRAQSYQALGDYTQAISDCNKALEIDPNFTWATNLIIELKSKQR